jgi:hypothetical protein
MATREHFVTRLLHEVEAFTFSAHVSKCWLHTRRCLGELLLAETTHLSIVLVASFTDMVRIGIALSAEVLLTVMAPDTVVSHVVCCLWC